MSSDLVKRLLERGGYFPTIEREAADRIEALEAEVARLRAALHAVRQIAREALEGTEL